MNAIATSVPFRILRVVAIAAMVLAETGGLWLIARIPPARRRAVRAAALHQMAARVVCALLGVQVEVKGMRPVDGPYLVVCNHLGYVDVLAIAANFRVVFVAEAKLRAWPVLGRLFVGLGTVFVARDRRRDAPCMVEQIRQNLVRGQSVLVFPEGTPTCGSDAVPFRSTPFQSVLGLRRVGVLPVCIELVSVDGRLPVGHLRHIACWQRNKWGKRIPLPKHLWRLLGTSGVALRLHIGRPFDPGLGDRKELARLAQDQVRALGTSVEERS